jgi:hypothetical protein
VEQQVLALHGVADLDQDFVTLLASSVAMTNGTAAAGPE